MAKSKSTNTKPGVAMSTPLWSDEEIGFLLKLIEEEDDIRYFNLSEKMEDNGFFRSPEAIRKFFGRNKQYKPEKNLLMSLMPDEREVRDVGEKDLLGRIKESKIQIELASERQFKNLGLPKDPAIKILCISDLHFPFHNKKVVEHAIENHSDADILVVNGDIFEGFMVSKWPKKKTILLEWEYKLAAEFLREVAPRFKHIALTSGNHEYRLNSYFAANIDPGVNFLVCNDILTKLSGGWDFDEGGEFKKLYNFDNVYYKGGLGSWYLKIGKTIFAHPRFFSSVPMRTAIKACEYFKDREDLQCVVMSHCFDEETELLTNNGWKNIDTISEADQPMTLNLEKDELELNPCEGIYKYDNLNELILFKNDTGLEIAVTPEHGMVYSTVHGEKRRWKRGTAEQIENFNRAYIPAAGLWKEQTEAELSDDLLKLLAWVMTEGSLDKIPSGNHRIRISQSKDKNDYPQRIEDILNNETIKYTKALRYEANTTKHGQHRNYDAYTYTIGVEETSKLLPYLDIGTKTLKHEFMMSLSLRQRQLFIQELCMGDGSKCGTKEFRHYYSSNKTLLDQFQTLCVLSGIRTKISPPRNDGTYVVYITYSNFREILSSERTSYKGRTWCLSVPNATLVARRKGSTFITQNTHKLGQYVLHDKLIIEQGCCCVPMDYEADGRNAPSLQSFGYAVIYMDKDGNVDFEKSKAIYRGTGAPIKADDLLPIAFG